MCQQGELATEMGIDAHTWRELNDQPITGFSVLPVIG